jgi:hypothetical protein
VLAELDALADIRAYDRLLKAQERKSRCIASLATRMRISQQSSYDKSKRKTVEPALKPGRYDE